MRRLWILSCTLLALAGCSISRVYVGAPLPGSPLTIEPGRTRIEEILDSIGAPNQILRGPRGEIFVYRYLRRDSRTFAIEEPVITNFEIFAYSVIKEREDRLVVLFDTEGIVLSWGRLDATDALDP